MGIGDEQASSTLEIERKYDVDDLKAQIRTDAGTDPAWSGAIRWGGSREHHLVATYVDTAGFLLLRNKITLRRRTGGSDAGWHLKRPGRGDARRELRVRLGADAPTWSDPGPVEIPAVLREQIADLIGAEPVFQVAMLTTLRTESDVLMSAADIATTQNAVAPESVVGAVVCDDLVQADVVSPSTGQTAASRWREWEVELVGPGDVPLLDTIEQLLLAAGGRPAGRASKLARALAPVLED